MQFWDPVLALAQLEKIPKLLLTIFLVAFYLTEFYFLYFSLLVTNILMQHFLDLT